MRCETLKHQKEESSSEIVQKELEDIKIHYKKLKVVALYFCFLTMRKCDHILKSEINSFQDEHDSFRDLADKMIEEKDNEISKLLNDIESLRQSLEAKPLVFHTLFHACIEKYILLYIYLHRPCKSTQ